MNRGGGLVVVLLSLGCESEVEIRREGKLTLEDRIVAVVQRGSDGAYVVGAQGLSNVFGFEAEAIGDAGACRVTETFYDPEADVEAPQPADGAFLDVEIGTEVYSFDLSQPNAVGHSYESEEPLFTGGDLVTFRLWGDGVPAIERTVTAIEIPAVVMPPLEDDGFLRLKRDEGFSVTWDPAIDAGNIELKIKAAMEDIHEGDTVTFGPVQRTLLCEVDASAGILTVEPEVFELLPATRYGDLSVRAGRHWTEEVEGWTVRLDVGGYAAVVGFEDSAAVMGMGRLWIE
jgi:hypothetical protein